MLDNAGIYGYIYMYNFLYDSIIIHQEPSVYIYNYLNILETIIISENCGYIHV